MKDGKAQKRLQPHKGNIGVENRIASPKPACKAPHEQKGLKGNAAPPDSLAEHFPPAQICEGRVGGILTWLRGEGRRAPFTPSVSPYAASHGGAVALVAAADRHHRLSKSPLGWRTATPHSAGYPGRLQRGPDSEIPL